MVHVIKHMATIGKPYKGILYGSFMKTDKNELKLIEFNCRFGDPECINVLNLLITPLDIIFKHIINNNLDQLKIEYKNTCQSLIYVVPSYYPIRQIDDQITHKMNSSILANDIFYTKDLKSYFQTNNVYVSSLNIIDNNNFTLNLTTSRCYAILFSEETLSDCEKAITKYFNGYPLNDTMFRRRKDIISSYLNIHQLLTLIQTLLIIVYKMLKRI